jgi:hypothetical protein
VIAEVHDLTGGDEAGRWVIGHGPVDKRWVLCGKRQIGADGRRAQT